MMPFNLYPDFAILSRYISFPEEPEVMRFKHMNGYPVEAGRFGTMELQTSFLTKFGSIVTSFSLQKHKHNLLLLALNLIEDYDENYHIAKEEHKFALRTKELATLLAVVSKQNFGELVINGNIKITDKVILERAKDALLRAFTPGALSISEFDAYPLYFMGSEGSLNNENIENATKVKLQALSTRLNQLEVRMSAELCLGLLPYLNNETNLSRGSNKYFSDQQLKFFYQLLNLLGIWKPSKKMGESPDYEPKDLMRRRLENYLKARQLKGNKK